MQDDITFIDDFVNSKIKDLKIHPSREWKDMQNYIKAKGVKSVSHRGFKNSFLYRKEMLIISVLTVFSASVFLYNSVDKNQNIPIIKSNKIILNTETKDISEKEFISDDKPEKSRIKNEVPDSSKKNIRKDETVKVKIKVPIHKKVIIKKNIYIKDTLDKK